MNTQAKFVIGSALAAGCILYASTRTPESSSSLGNGGEYFADPAGCMQKADGLELWYMPSIPADFASQSSRVDTVYFHGVRTIPSLSLDSIILVAPSSHRVSRGVLLNIFTDERGNRTVLSDAQFARLGEQLETALTYCTTDETKTTQMQGSYASSAPFRRFI